MTFSDLRYLPSQWPTLIGSCTAIWLENESNHKEQTNLHWARKQTPFAPKFTFKEQTPDSGPAFISWEWGSFATRNVHVYKHSRNLLLLSAPAEVQAGANF